MIAELAMVNKLGQVVMDSEEELVKKKNKYAAKKKERLAKLQAPVGFTLSPYPKSSPFLLSCSMPTSMPAFIPAPVTTPIFRPRSPAILSSYHVPAPISRPRLLAVLLSC